MKHLVSTVLVVALLLGLGALAVLARGGGAILAPADSVVAAAVQPQTAAAPDSVPVSLAFNLIAMPLNASAQFTAQGLTFDAAGLAAFAGSSTVQVGRWDPNGQIYQTWTIDPDFGGQGTNFPLQVGGAYWLLRGPDTNNVISFVGNVPPPSGQPGAVQFPLVSGASCQFNQFSLPLDKSSITDADLLAQALGPSAQQVAQWDPVQQIFETWTIDPDFGGGGTNFTTKIGYPYIACLLTGAPNVWP
jgi:hypothetical protein